MPTGTVLRDAALQVWERRPYFGRLLLIPVALTAITGYIQELWFDPHEEQSTLQLFTTAFLFVFIEAAVFALFAVVIHRSILLNEYASPTRWFLRLNKREFRFVGYSLLIGIGMWLIFAIGATLSALLSLAITVFGSTFLNATEQTRSWNETLGLTILGMAAGSGAAVLFAYFAARSSLVLPAIALDDPHTFKWAWAASKPHTWRLAFLVGIVPLISIGFQMLGSTCVGDSPWNLLNHTFSALVTCSLLIVEISILSISYRWITESVVNHTA